MSAPSSAPILFVRQVSQDELPLMRDLYAQMYDAIGNSGPPEKRILEVHRQAVEGERSFWLASILDDIVGLIDFKVMPYQPRSDEQFGMIFDLFIKEEFQRRGYGRELAKLAIASMVEQGADPIELNVLPDNTKALAFWRSLGFKLYLYSLKLSASDAT